MRKIGRFNRISLSKWKKGVTKTPEKIICSCGEYIMKMCSKCETIALDDTAIQCPNCGETFSNYQAMKTKSKPREL